MNVAVFLTPQPTHPDLGDFFLAGIAEGEGLEGVAPLSDLLPPDWKGQYTPHLYEIREDFDIETDVVWSRDMFKRDGVTHVALLEGPKTDRVKAPYYFAGEKIEENGVLCWYRKETGDFFLFHCAHCAKMILQWVTNRQEEWDAASRQGQSSKARN